MSAPARPAGLVHAAVLSNEPQEVLSRCLPELRRVVSDGRELDVCADRRYGRLFREGLPDATMHFPSPVGQDARDLAHRLPDRSGVGAVVGTVCSNTVSTEGHDAGVLAEDALTLLLSDVPITVICIYDPTDADGLRVARRTHPWLLTDQGCVVNEGFRPPATSSPVPGDLLGPALLDVPVPDGTMLAGLRPRVAERARAEGMGDEQVAETVFAAHEALLVAGGAGLAGGTLTDLPSGDHGVLLRRTRYGIVAECRGVPPVGEGRAEQSDRLVVLSRLCDGLTVHDDAAGRLVRALVRHR